MLYKTLLMDCEYQYPEDFAADDSFVNYCLHSDEKDVEYWKQWLAEHPDKKETAHQAREMVFFMSAKISPEQKQQEWNNVKRSLEDKHTGYPAGKSSTSPGRKKWLAAGVTAVLLGGIILTYLTNRKKVVRQPAIAANTQYITTPGQRHAIVLEDGTHVWLNAGSKLTWAPDFKNAALRKVILSGEAYFDVAPDASRPFVVHTNRLDVKVLGTAFNLKVYPDDRTAEAALIQGSIEVKLPSDSGRQIILKPNEKLTVFKNVAGQKDIRAAVKKIQSSAETPEEYKIAPLHNDPLLDSGMAETAWLKGTLVFHSEQFDQLAKQMERKYGVHFHFGDDQLKTYRFTGIFSTETIEQALHALQLTTPTDPFSYKVEEKEVYVTTKSN